MKRGHGGLHTTGEWEIKKFNITGLAQLGKRQEPKIKLTKDHIIQ